MQNLILTLFILATITLVIAYFISEDGLKRLEKIQAIFNKINPNSENMGGVSKAKLARAIFYNYHHQSVFDWRNWIMTQNSSAKALALKLLEDHLQDQPKYWGNITSEVLDGLEAFQEFDLGDTLQRFLKKSSPLWLEYLVVPSLYEKALSILYTIDRPKAIKFISSEFSTLKVPNDRAFKQKAKLIISTITQDEETGAECIVSIMNDDKIPVELKRDALQKVFGFDEEIQKEVLRKILKPYLLDPRKTEQRKNEFDYELRLEILKSIIQNIIQFISSPDVFQTLASLCRTNPELARLIHNKVLAIINNSNTELELSQLIAFNYLPDTKDNKIKIALANQKNLPQSQVREIILKPRLRPSHLNTAMGKESQEFPIPSCQKDLFKSLSKKLGQTKGNICNGIVDNTLLLLGNDKLRKSYLCHSIATKAGVELKYIDLQFINSDSSLFSARKQIDESGGLIYIESMEELIKVTSRELSTKLNTFFNDIKNLSKSKELRFIFSFNHSKADIDKDSKLQLFYKTHFTKNISDQMEINSSGNYKQSVLDHYANQMKLKSEDFSEFTEEFHSNNNFSNELEYEFAYLEELSTQLLVFGKPNSYLEVETQRKQLFSKPSKATII